jgi:hypothetical protein
VKYTVIKSFEVIKTSAEDMGTQKNGKKLKTAHLDASESGFEVAFEELCVPALMTCLEDLPSSIRL